MLSCIVAFERKKKVIMFCSDVQGAFDKVSEERFAEKISKSGLPDISHPIVRVVDEEQRRKFSYERLQSAGVVLSDMVYQGTV